jgi:hypothetical protein
MHFKPLLVALLLSVCASALTIPNELVKRNTTDDLPDGNPDGDNTPQVVDITDSDTLPNGTAPNDDTLPTGTLPSNDTLLNGTFPGNDSTNLDNDPSSPIGNSDGGDIVIIPLDDFTLPNANIPGGSTAEPGIDPTTLERLLGALKLRK